MIAGAETDETTGRALMDAVEINRPAAKLEQPYALDATRDIRLEGARCPSQLSEPRLREGGETLAETSNSPTWIRRIDQC